MCALCVFDVLPGVTVRRNKCETVASGTVDSQGVNDNQLPMIVDASHDPKYESAVTSTPTLYKSTQNQICVQTPSSQSRFCVHIPRTHFLEFSYLFTS